MEVGSLRWVPHQLPRHDANIFRSCLINLFELVRFREQATCDGKGEGYKANLEFGYVFGSTSCRNLRRCPAAFFHAINGNVLADACELTLLKVIKATKYPRQTRQSQIWQMT